MKYNGLDVLPVLHCYEREKALLVLVAPNLVSPCIYIDHAQMNHLCLAHPNRLVTQSFTATAPMPGHIRLVLQGDPSQVHAITGTRGEFQTLNASITWTVEPPTPIWRINIDNSNDDQSNSFEVLLVVPRNPAGVALLTRDYPSVPVPRPTTQRGQQWCVVLRDRMVGNTLIHSTNNVRLY